MVRHGLKPSTSPPSPLAPSSNWDLEAAAAAHNGRGGGGGGGDRGGDATVAGAIFKHRNGTLMVVVGGAQVTGKNVDKCFDRRECVFVR